MCRRCCDAVVLAICITVVLSCAVCWHIVCRRCVVRQHVIIVAMLCVVHCVLMCHHHHCVHQCVMRRCVVHHHVVIATLRHCRRHRCCVVMALATDVALLSSLSTLRGGHVVVAASCVNLVSIMHHHCDAVALAICIMVSLLCHAWCMVHDVWCVMCSAWCMVHF